MNKMIKKTYQNQKLMYKKINSTRKIIYVIWKKLKFFFYEEIDLKKKKIIIKMRLIQEMMKTSEKEINQFMNF